MTITKIVTAAKGSVGQLHSDNTSRVQFLLCLKLYRWQHAVSNMFAFWIVEHLDVVEYVLSCFISGLVDFAPNAFAVKEVEEAFGNGIVVTVAPAAQGVFQIVLFQE